MLILLRFVLPLTLATCLLLITNPEISLADGATTVPTDNYANTLPKGFFTPTGRPKFVGSGWFGMVLTRMPGFLREPVQEQNIDKNTTDHRLEAKLSQSPRPITYQWYKSDGISGAKPVPDSNNPYIDIPTDKEGTFYYQLFAHTSHYNILHTLIDDKCYSKVAKVIINKKHIDATSLTINNDTSYLFNESSDFFQNTTQIMNTTEPYNASGTINWSVSDNDLATIDQNGVLTANQKNNSGIVTVQARINNSNGKVIKSNSLNILIGGGLENVDVDEGEKAIFRIANTEVQAREKDGLKTEWYKVDTNGKAQKLSQSKDANPFQYSFNADLKDDGSKYFVKVYATENNKTTLELQTNQATLSVIPNKNIENLDFNSEIVNDTDTHNLKNNYDELFDVAKNDTILINSKIENNNSTDLTGSKLVLAIPTSLSVQNIEINKVKLDSNNYSISKENNELTISLGTIPKNSITEITIKSIMDKQSLQSAAYLRPYLVGTVDLSKFRKKSNLLKLNFIENSLHLAFKNIHFHPISQFQKGILDTRTDDTNAPNAIMNVDDQRRVKDAQTISVQQQSDFPNNGALPFAQLMLKTKDSLVPIDKLTEIAHFEKGIPITPVIWSKDEGLLLKVNTNAPSPGNYSINLQWTISDSIPQSS